MQSRCIFDHADLDAPQNVRLEAIDPYTVYMRWDPPPQPDGVIIGYRIAWNLDSAWQDTFDLPPVQTHAFEGLQPGQKLFAFISARTSKGAVEMHEYLGSSSRKVETTTPSLKEGESHLLVLPNTDFLYIRIDHTKPRTVPV